MELRTLWSRIASRVAIRLRQGALTVIALGIGALTAGPAA
jgi:hypothetical protein